MNVREVSLELLAELNDLKLRAKNLKETTKISERVFIHLNLRCDIALERVRKMVLEIFSKDIDYDLSPEKPMYGNEMIKKDMDAYVKSYGLDTTLFYLASDLEERCEENPKKILSFSNSLWRRLTIQLANNKDAKVVKSLHSFLERPIDEVYRTKVLKKIEEASMLSLTSVDEEETTMEI